MNITIVADDKTVGINGEFYVDLDLSGLPLDIHAVQWYGSFGEVEYKTQFLNGVFVKPMNKPITDFSDFAFIFPIWNNAKEQNTVLATDVDIPVTVVE